jgi:hypothetical protein
MAFKRRITPHTQLEGEALTAAMASIGINFAAPSATEANIEDTLHFAAMEGLEKHDLRVLAALATWFEMHHPIVNADRLIRVIQNDASVTVRAWWSALALWMRADRRFARLAALYKGPRLDLLPTGTDFHVSRHGEDARFAKSLLRVPSNILRNRSADVVSVAALVKRHRVYRSRVVMGPSYRADLWAALQDNPALTASELARLTYASFASAWEVKRDFALVKGESAQLE